MNLYTRLFFYFSIGFLAVSCISTNDMIYLQKKNEVTSATTVSQLHNKPYRLQINDIVNVTIKSIDPKFVEIFAVNANQTNLNNDQAIYFNGYSVDDHGNIRLPILGEVNVLGFTTDEVRLFIENKLLSEYFNKQAGIFVSVKLAGFRYTINGEVTSTGTKVIYQDRVNIMEAIANAGDILMTGDRKDVKVIRRFPHGNETYSIDLTDDASYQSPVFNLQPNDYIYVKPLKQKSWGTGTTGLQSLTTIVTILSLATTTIVLLRN